MSDRPIKSVIIGTAGHIDHGKTTLVKALTGIDADRLAEEKRRGITIDLGFAHMQLATPTGEQLRIGFVDVPGHERFVRNMLAGAGGIDVVLFVVAADESVKPQTREHFEICRLLNVQRGIVVLTKADLVDTDMLDLVKIELEELFRGSFLDLAKTPCIAVSATKGTGLDELKLAIAEVAALVAGKPADALARLPIDRVFTMKGHGTVITGTLVAGTVCKEDELEALPLGRKLRVRNVQVHGASAEQAIAGERTALNLAGAEVDDLARGEMLVTPGSLRTSKSFDVRLELTAEAGALRDRSRVHLHAFTSEAIAQVVLLEGKELKPGGSALAQLRTAEALVLVPGDRFIIRSFSPVVTIGGGMVLDAMPLKRRAKDSLATAKWLKLLEAAAPAEALELRVARRDAAGLNISDAVAETGLTRGRITALVDELVARRALLRIAEHLFAVAAVKQAAEELTRELASFHKANPLVAGTSKEALREKLGLASLLFDHVAAELTSTQKIESSGEQLRAAGRSVALSADEQKARNTIEQAFATAGLKVPALKEVLAGLPIDRVRAQKIVTLLLRDRVLIKLSEDLVFHSAALTQLRSTLSTEKAKSPKLDVARFKDLTGVSRKYAIPLLEYLDRERVTRRVGDERVIL